VQTDLKRFATQFVTLKLAREEADYNQGRHYDKSEAENLIVTAGSAIEHLNLASKEDVAGLIVALLLTKPKR
jgi:pyruvate/2-oxoacid:ferredoxin oxidoreductase alpha subunit